MANTYSSKGLTIHFTKNAEQAANVKTTAITAIAGNLVTVASTTNITAGDMIVIKSTGTTDIDGQVFVAGAVDGTAKTVEAIGLDTSNFTLLPIESAATLEILPKSELISVCLSTFTLAVQPPQTISVATYCNTTATIKSSVQEAGTLTLGGFLDKTDAAYKELLDAEDDEALRYIKVTLPKEQGYIVAPVKVTQITWGLPLDGAIAFTVTAQLDRKPKHRFA